MAAGKGARKREGQGKEGTPTASKRPKASDTSAGSKKNTPTGDVADPEAWLRDEKAVKTWLKQFDVREMLDKSKGLVHLDGFLPNNVAELVLERVMALKKSDFEAAQSDEYDSIEHSFSLAEPIESSDLVLQAAARLLWWMMPDTTPNFSIGRYCQNDHISPHDDKVLERYTKGEYRKFMSDYLRCKPKDVPLPEAYAKGKSVVYSREVALVYYMNKNWTEQQGGLFIDLEADKPYLPSFNSLVMFRVPRMHGVTPVLANKKNLKPIRYSIFGWWLVEGELYAEEDVYSGEEASGSGSEDEDEDEEDEDEDEKPVRSSDKGKRRKR